MQYITAKDIKPDLAKQVYSFLEKKADGFSLTVDGFAYVCELCTGEPHPERTVRGWCERGTLGADAARKLGGKWFIHKNEAIKVLHRFFPEEKKKALEKAYSLQMQFFKS